MELIIAAAIIIVILLILGVSVQLIIQGVLWILEILLLLMTLFFLASVVFILIGKPCKAEFLRIETDRKWGSAVYQIDGEERQTIYPAEMILRNIIYKKPVTHARLWQHGASYLLFDWYSILCAALGFPLSGAGAAFLGWFLLQVTI